MKNIEVNIGSSFGIIWSLFLLIFFIMSSQKISLHGFFVDVENPKDCRSETVPICLQITQFRVPEIFFTRSFDFEFVKFLAFGFTHVKKIKLHMIYDVTVIAFST